MKGPDLSGALRRYGWNQKRDHYACADGAAVVVARGGPKVASVTVWVALGEAGEVDWNRQPSGQGDETVAVGGPRSGLVCKASSRAGVRLASVSGAVFDRRVTGLVRHAGQTKAFTCPRTLRELGRCAFQSCRGVERVWLNAGLETVGLKCFCGTMLSRVDFPASVRELRTGAFDGCYHLARVAIPGDSRLEKIGLWAFGHTAIEEFAAPAALRRVCQGAFYKCERLRSVALNEGLGCLGADVAADYWGPGIFEGSGLEAVRLPAGLRALGTGVFYRAARLAEATLPAGLEAIGAYCFAESGLARLAVPASVREIKKSAFQGCERLCEVTLAPGSRLERVGARAFAGVPAEIALPAGAEVAPDALTRES